jgi:hypothetical protein
MKQNAYPNSKLQAATHTEKQTWSLPRLNVHVISEITVNNFNETADDEDAGERGRSGVRY